MGGVLETQAQAQGWQRPGWVPQHIGPGGKRKQTGSCRKWFP